MSLETVRLSQRAKDQLNVSSATPESRTGTCSAAGPSVSRWPTACAGAREHPRRQQCGDDLEGVRRARRRHLPGPHDPACRNDGLRTDPETVAEQFRLHLHRGIGYLFGDPSLKSLTDCSTGALRCPTARHRTAMRRTHLSRPIRLAFARAARPTSNVLRLRLRSWRRHRCA